jgi:pyrroline-5-carboxylate reductase
MSDLLPATEPTWIVGCGNMAGAMVEGWRGAGIDLSRAVVIRPSGTPVEGVRTVRTLSEAGRQPGLVLLGFKPQMLDAVAPGLAPWITRRTTIVSILAGVEGASLRARFPAARTIVRAMPNLSVAVRRGIVPLYSEDVGAAEQASLGELFRALGMAIWCSSIETFGAVGGISGPGPAYVARFIAGLAEAGISRGLDPELALSVARETVFGSAWLAAATGEPMDDLVARVRSPGGTTQAGLEVLDAELPDLIDRTLAAASRRSAELAAAARG